MNNGSSEGEQLKPTSLSVILISAITSAALGLRLWGIGWGLPNALHYFSYHTDETVILMHSTSLFRGGLNVFAGNFLPHFYNYGSLQLVLINIAFCIVSAYIHQGSRLDDVYLAYLTGRILTALMGAATVWALWAFGRRVYNEAAGITGAALLAVTPLHAQQSHFMTVDAPATLWVVLALLWSSKVLTDQTDRRLRSLATAGIMAGFAAATKYNCALVLLPVLYAALVNRDLLKHGSLLAYRARGAAAALLFCVIAYLVGCPGTLLEPNLFIHDFQMEALHVSSQQELWFQGTGIGWWYIIERNLADGMGLPLLIAAGAGLIWALRKRTHGDWLTLAFALPYYLVVGAAVSRYARYEIPLLPILALWAGRVLIDQEIWKVPRLAVSIPAVLVGAFTLLSAIALLKLMSEIDPRDRAADWISANVPADEQIGMPVVPWFWSPPLSPYFSTPGATGQWMGMPGGLLIARRIVPNYAALPEPSPFDVNALVQQKPPVVVMSEYEYFDRLRLQDPATISYIAELRRSYKSPIVFSDTHWLGGMHSIDGLPCQDLPHDMLYTSPTVLIFQRS